MSRWQTVSHNNNETNMSQQSPQQEPKSVDEDMVDENADQDSRRRQGRLPLGVDDIARLMKVFLELRPIGQETAERVLEVFLKLLNRREVLERILRSEFMRNVRDMQSEITEAIGIASQADVQEIKTKLDVVTEKLDRLQRTLDEISVEVEEA